MDKKYKYLHIAFVPEELEELDTFINAQVPKITRSEFIREAVRDKIRKINNPEIFLERHGNFSEALLKKMTEDLAKSNKRQELILERMKKFESIEKTLELIQERANVSLTAETQTILNLFQSHKSLKPAQIIDKTGYDQNTVMIILANKELFKLNISTGRFERA